MGAKFYTLYLLVVFLGGLDRCLALNVEKDEPCTQTGQICSDDCTQILLCTEVGAEPILVKTCDVGTEGEGYCKLNDSGNPECATEEPECGTPANENVECGDFGEFPHPKRCDTTIKCSEALVITQICTCSKGSYIDITRNNLPCIEGECPRGLVECNEIGEIGTYPGSRDFCYTCWYDSTQKHNVTQVYPCPSRRNLKSAFFPLPKAKQCRAP